MVTILISPLLISSSPSFSPSSLPCVLPVPTIVHAYLRYRRPAVALRDLGGVRIAEHLAIPVWMRDGHAKLPVSEISPFLL